MTPRVSIVTLTHNKLEVTRLCLPTLLKTAEGVTWELIVVDNGSSDGTPEWLKEFKEEAHAKGISVTILQNETNIGCSTARNQGINAASGEFIAFIDNDVALRSANWLQHFIQLFSQMPDAGVIGPRIVYPFPPYNIQCAGVGISRNGRVLFRGRGESREAAEFTNREAVQALISACFIVRADLLSQYGGFDEAFNPVEFEDFDLCYRLREQGMLAIYEPAIEMYHFESVTTQGTKALPNTALIIRNGLEFKRRWHKMFSKENGPADELTRWKRLPATDIKKLGDMPILQEQQ